MGVLTLQGASFVYVNLAGSEVFTGTIACKSSLVDSDTSWD